MGEHQRNKLFTELNFSMKTLVILKVWKVWKVGRIVYPSLNPEITLLTEPILLLSTIAKLLMTLFLPSMIEHPN